MKNSFVILCLLLLVGSSAFSQGIVFEKGTWKEVLAKAKQENKLVFVDVYTSWCGPCKMVAKTVFPQEKVGNYYNQHFINYQIDGEKGEGPGIVKKYQVKNYPTFLYLNGEGELVYQFLGATDVKGFIEEANKVTTCAKFGGWNKMQEVYKSGGGDSDFLWAYYELASEDKQGEVLNKYLKSLPDEKLYTVAVGKMMEDDITQYDYDLMKRMVEGRVKLGAQEEEFDFFFTFGLQRMLAKYFDLSIENSDKKWFEELLGLKRKFNELPRTSDPDINMCWGRGAFFTSEDFLNLRYWRTSGIDDTSFQKSLEVYMEKLMDQNPLDTLVNRRKLAENMIKQSPELVFFFDAELGKGQVLIASSIIDFIDYYWRMMPSDKATRERCAVWVNYACNLNPYNAEAPLNAASLLIRLKHKKDAVAHLERAIEKQKILQGNPEKQPTYNKNKFAKIFRGLENRLRDVQNDKI
ncbi:MAG: thioredoxin family protein [Odoribacter sp.]